LPELVKFSYISPTEFESHVDAKSHRGAKSVDYSLTAKLQKGYVLVLDFQDDAKGRKNAVATQQVHSIVFRKTMLDKFFPEPSMPQLPPCPLQRSKSSLKQGITGS
jgi:hypothetical protein